MGSACRFIELDEPSAFARVRECAGPVLIYVTPLGSGDCQEVARSLEALVHRYPERVFYGHLALEKAPAFARAYGITPAPTLLLIRGGRVLHRLVGVTCLDPVAPALCALIERSREGA
jgi:thioredoxin-like negative regulator of GroEL